MPSSQDGAPLVVTMGDPAGIGPEITLSAWMRRLDAGLPPFAVLADPVALAERARGLDMKVPIEAVEPADVPAAFGKALPVVPLAAPVKPCAGYPDDTNAPAIIESMERAVDFVHAGLARAIVTNPISKAVLYARGFAFPGHTEFLADRAGRHAGRAIKPVMMLAGPKLRTVPLTIHVPLRQVFELLTLEAIVETVTIVERDLRERFRIDAPRIAVAGLNPHAGEGGAMGSEDRDIIAPAVATLRARGVDARGPMPADTMFHDAARQSYDVAVCMYHDQALIPAKTLGFDDAVNVTLGLPFVRTSPDHGTAFDIAGKGIARADSLIAAIRMADEMTRRP